MKDETGCLTPATPGKGSAIGQTGLSAGPSLVKKAPEVKLALPYIILEIFLLP